LYFRLNSADFEIIRLTENNDLFIFKKGVNIIANQKRRANKYPLAPKNKKRHFLRYFFVTLGVVVVAGGAFAAVIYFNLKKTLSTTFVSTKSSTIVPTKPLTIVLMGVDTGDTSRGGDNSWDGNSDSQIVLTLNPKTNTTTMVSMERDTMTNILNASGQVESTQKMNAAFPYGFNADNGLTGAVQDAMSTIGEQAGIPITNFVTVNMDGLVNLVNDVGGVDVVNDDNGQDVYQGTSAGQQITLPVTNQTVDSGAIYISNTEPEYTASVPYLAGDPEQLINGDQALVFARDRDTLANGDYGRAAHQREVIQQLLKKMLSLSSVSKYQSFLGDISKDFKTNISFDSSNLSALMAYKNCFNKVVSVQYQGIGESATGSDGNAEDYQFMPQNVDLAVQNLMRTSVGLSTETSLDSKMITYESEFGPISQNYLMPSATVTVKGKAPVTYGVGMDGGLVSIDSSNSGDYVSTTGSTVTASSGTDSTATSSTDSTTSTGN
jgi:LCP family protein required for cell wall assembly